MDPTPALPSSPANSQSAPNNSSSKPSRKSRKHRPSVPAATTEPPPPTPPTPPPPDDDERARISNVRDQPPPPNNLQPSARFTAHLQPYPGPTGPPPPPAPYPPMNPPYPNGNLQYPNSPSPFHQPPSPANGQTPNVLPAVPPSHPSAYAYGVHHAAPPYYSYPSYPGMMMYAPPPPNHAESSAAAGQSTSAAASPIPTTGKRKRTYTFDESYGRQSDRDGADSGSDLGRSVSAATLAESKKRTKTQRACDSCRARKIRCDVLADSDPAICQHCKQYNFDCTFFLPITETRFKKKKLEEEAAAAEKEKEREAAERSTSSPQTDHSKSAGDIKIFGPTSAAHLLHSQALVSSRTYESYDMRYHHSWDVSASGEGIIRVHEPQEGELQLALPKPVEMHIERGVIEQLVNAYFTEVAPMLPVVTFEEFVASNPPQPILLYSLCLVAATRRNVPQTVFDSLRYTVNSLIKADDVLSTASIVNCQALLVLCMVGDSHSQFVPNALSAMWIRLGCAIRMAQDLGLHRAESVKERIELRRRLWAICVISDRWMAVTFGHPHMIDINDCDARLPSSDDPNDKYLGELVRLSVILGRVMKSHYSPAGLNMTNDADLHKLLADIEEWRNNLPPDLQFRGPESPRSAGLLFLLYLCVNMMFWRVFMRISYSCPAHLKFSLTVEKWTALRNMSSDAIDWLDAHENVYDVWLLVAYCTTSCALIQYHTFARRQDPEAQAKLRKLRDIVRRWEASLSPDHMSTRRKTAEIIALLYEATHVPVSESGPPALNPTSGVKGKPPPPLGGLKFQKDSSRPGGGVFVAQGNMDVDTALPTGTIINTDGATVTQAGNAPAGSSGGSGSMVGFAPLGGFQNLNPALNGGAENVQVMNVLDMPQGIGMLEQQGMADVNFLDGIPADLLNWNGWETFFARFPVNGAESRADGLASAPPLQPQQQYYPGDPGM